MAEPAVHIGLIAWQRVDATQRTLDALREHNDLGAFRLHYALDGGYAPELPPLLEDAGFRPAVLQDRQVGIARMHEDLAGAIARDAEPGDVVLLLENDWECARPIPTHAIRKLLKCRLMNPIGVVWLYGPWKERGKGNRSSIYHLGNPQHPRILWTAGHVLGEFVLIGRGYWSHPPCAARAAFIQRSSACGRPGEDKAPAEHRFWSGALGCNVAWLLDPVFYHVSRTSYRKLGGKRC